MRKEYRNAIIGGISGGVVSAIIFFIIQGYFSWTFLILSVILSPLALLVGLKMRKKREGPVEGGI
jgi:uncharacterized membrane protein